MTLRTRYENARMRFLHDETICAENRTLIAQFLNWQEYKLRRRYGLTELDDPCLKTMCGYVIKLRAVNRWFGNKAWKDLTRDDIKRVYDDLEDGRILSSRGRPYEDLPGYYAKILKGKPFMLAGKAEITREIIDVTTHRPKPVRYVTEEIVRSLSDALTYPHHRFLLWLAWDLGENIGALVQLRKSDFTVQSNRDSGEREYLVRLSPEKLKRSRRARAEITLYTETVEYGDPVLAQLQDGDLVFPLQIESARKFLLIAAVGGRGGSSYIDSVILRDRDNSEKWFNPSDGLDTRIYYCQNWRQDVVATIGPDDAGTGYGLQVLERVKYDSYGRPRLFPIADYDHDGDVDGADNTAFYAEYGGAGSPKADINFDGGVNGDDSLTWLAQYGTDPTENRKLYAGYEWDPVLAPGTADAGVYHVRNRVLLSELGRWSRRDPIGYVDGANILAYGRGHPIVMTDPRGFLTKTCTKVAGTQASKASRSPIEPCEPSDPLPPCDTDETSAACKVLCAQVSPGSPVPPWGVTPGSGFPPIVAPYCCVCLGNIRGDFNDPNNPNIPANPYDMSAFDIVVNCVNAHETCHRNQQPPFSRSHYCEEAECYSADVSCFLNSLTQCEKTPKPAACIETVLRLLADTERSRQAFADACLGELYPRFRPPRLNPNGELDL